MDQPAYAEKGRLNTGCGTWFRRGRFWGTDAARKPPARDGWISIRRRFRGEAASLPGSSVAGLKWLWDKKGYNIGIATGARSGVFVLDIDGMAGEHSLAELQVEHGALPVTLTCASANGWHMYFRHPGQRVPNSQSKLDPKIDVRGDGGCIMAPPSIHPSGKRYTWVDETVPIAEAPGWLVALATKERERPAQAFQRNETAGDRWSDVEVQRMLDAAKPLANGTRDEWLRVGMALHAGGYPFEMWDTWSRTAPDRYQPGSTAVNWRGFKEGGVSIGTLVHLARERGWAPEWMRGREEGRADAAGRPMPVKYQETGLYHQLSSNRD